MNDLLRKITAGILSATMVLTGMGVFPAAMADLFAYAGSSDEPSVDHSANSSVYDAGMTAYTPASDIYTERPQSYMLEVSTGVQPGDCVKSIILTYYTSASYKEDDVYVTQVLNPVKNYFGDDYLFEKNKEEAGAYALYKKDYLANLDDGGENIQFVGSRFATYSAYFRPGKNRGIAVDDFADYPRILGDLITNADSVVEQFPMPDSKSLREPFPSESTEYIEFQFEYDFYELRTISFYCEGTANDSWDFQHWELYEKAGPDYNGSIKTSTYFSDDVRIEYTGNLLAHSIPKTEKRKDGKEVENKESFGFVNSGMLTFAASDKVNEKAINGTPLYDHFFTVGGSVTNLNPKVYYFSVNIRDSYKAGIDSFQKLPGAANLTLSEMLKATINYNDSYGGEREITVPVFSDALMDYFNGNVAGGRNIRRGEFEQGKYLSYAQQGESIVFGLSFADITSINSITFSYDNPDFEDVLIIDDVVVYHNDGATVGMANDSYVDREAYQDRGNGVVISDSISKVAGFTPVYKTPKVSGGIVLEGSDPLRTLEFKPVSEVKEETPDYSTTYCVTVTTSNVNFADTTDDVYVTFSYVDGFGKEKQTQEYSLKEACKDFYGYNPGVDAKGNIVDGSYNYCMRQGGSLSFFIDVASLDHFTGMQVRLAEGGTDEWQMSSVTVNRVPSIGERVATALEDTKVGGVTVNRAYDRLIPTSGQAAYEANTTILVQKDSVENIDLETGKATDDSKRRDYSEYYYDMDYKTATSELHIDDGAWKYQVKVNVQKNSISGTKTDDCGSNNLFYFQLVFELGTSAYVLANQQLKDDCFRAGEEETFVVCVNENMGELIAVNIIPDDVTDDAQPLDKLCIDSIEVIKSNPDTANKRYVCENVGWINVVYTDNEEEVKTLGRNASELVTTIPVDYSAYVLSLEVTLGIDSYTNAEGVTGDQFVGGMTCDVVYHTSTGERKKAGPIQMVAAMYDYANRQSKVDDNYGYVSDPSFMFRANHFNRFILDIPDAVSIESITINGKPQTYCDLPIGGISIKYLESDGNLIINNNGDFEKVYYTEPTLLTDEIPGRSLPHSFAFPANTWTSYTFAFGDNEIRDLDQETPSRGVVPRQPQSCNDTLNLYVYMADGVPTPAEGNYNVTAKVYYSSVSTSNTYVNETCKMKSRTEGGRTVLYAQGLSATNISILTNLNLTAPGSYGDYSIKADYAIVQQVRNGVVINTYKVYFDSAIISKEGGISMRTKASANTLGYSQKVSLLLGEGIDVSRLVPEKYDIALALKYTSSTSGGVTELKSPYVFATDSDILSIKGGSIIEFNFNEAYVDQVTGVEIIAMNGLDIAIDCGNVVCRSTDDAGEITIDGWFSMAEPAVFKEDKAEMAVTSNSADDANALKRAKFSFVTQSQSTTIDSGGTAPIKMIISYRDSEDQLVTKEFADIRSGATGGFTAGEEAVLEVFLKGVKSLNYMEIVPYDEDDTSIASWNLESVSFSLEGIGDSSEHSMPVNRTIYEITETTKSDSDISNYFNMSTMKMGMKRVVGGEAVYDDTAVQEITVAGGSSVELTPALTGGKSGYYKYFYDKVTGGNTERITTVDQAVGAIPFVFENNTGENQVYRVTMVAYENPTIRVVVTINVTPTKIEDIDIPETPDVTPTEDSGTTTGETTGGDTPATNPEEPAPAESTTTGSQDGKTESKTRKREEETSYDA